MDASAAGQIAASGHGADRLLSQGRRPENESAAETAKRGRSAAIRRFLKAGSHGKRERESVPFPCPLSL